ncbi:MAG: glycine zipper domain-containing protein [Rubripirellula sp.]
MRPQHRLNRSPGLTCAAICLVGAFAGLAPSRLQAQGNTKRGATLGGLAGAVAGAAIGDHNGEAGVGAAIGGVVGAVTGGLLGNAKDQEQAYHRQQQAYQTQQQHIAYQQSAVSMSDVVSMTRSGLSENVIINQIQQRGVQTKPQVSDIISLHQEGVSENVITVMQQAPTGPTRVTRIPQPVAVPVITPAPVIVEEHYLVPHYAPPRRYYYRRPIHHRSHRSGLHIGF